MRTTVHQITVLATTIALVALAGPPAIAAGLSSPGPPGSDQASAAGDSRAPQATGGPEEFGYTWDDSDAFALIEEQLATRGITAGCGVGNYCPQNPVTRVEMAVFLVKTFSLP
jgi:hypothetical protein